jgi:hypothetical protein
LQSRNRRFHQAASSPHVARAHIALMVV